MRLNARTAGGLLVAVACFTGSTHAAVQATTETRPAQFQNEVEPNNKPDAAMPIDPAIELRGELGIRDNDYFRLSLGDTDHHRDIEFVFDTEVRTDLCLYEADGTRIKCARGASPVFRHLSLSGDFVISISSVAALDTPLSYRLQISAPRPNLPQSEVEPNDRWGDATPLIAATDMRGRIGHGDKDVYRVTIPGPRQRWQITSEGPSIGSVELRTGGGQPLQKRSSRQNRLLDALYLPPGDYLLAVGSRNAAAPDDYQIRIEPAPAGVSDGSPQRHEAEPNDSKGQAQRLSFDTAHSGYLRAGDTDMYRFHLPGSARVRIVATPPPGSTVQLALDGQKIAETTENSGAASFAGTLLPGDHLLRLRARKPGDGPYSLQVSLTDPLDEDDAALDDIDLALRGDIPTLTAYAGLGQRRRFAVEVSNSGTQVRDLKVVHYTSAVDWQLRTEPSTLTLGPGEHRRVAVVLDVLPDARADIPVLISLGVRDSSGATASVARSMQAACDAPLVGARRLWRIPEQLLGKINAAHSGLGGKVIGETRNSAAGIDGVVSRSTGAWLAKPGDFTVDLAGDRPLTVLGAILHPVGSSKTSVQLKDFELQLSADGVSFHTVLTETLTADLVEQPFVLEAPTAAKFARLRLKSSIAEDGRAVGFGEFKVIVDESPAEILGHEVNIGDYPVGGFDVYSAPFTGGNCCHETFSTFEQDGQFRRGSDSYEWVMGFRDNRAARIQRFEWIDRDQQGETSRALRQVSIAVSLTSPVGPWTDVAAWSLRRKTSDTATLSLDSPIWARYVRFSAAPPEEGGIPLPPRQVRIFEAPVDAAYRSVLGEWGYGHSEGQFEYDLKGSTASIRRSIDAGNSADSATPLAFDTVEYGDVLVGEDEDWYAVDVPDGANQLTLRLYKPQSMEYAFEVLDAALGPVETKREPTEDALEVSAFVTPGRYLFRLHEPPRSIIFAWDTSGSVGPYYDIIDHTMKAFASGVRRGREEVNLIPFNDPHPELMLESWSSEAAEVHAAIVNSDRRFGSSNTESALLLAATELGRRDGTRAVLLITDAETDGLSQTDSLWNQLDRTRPRIFAFELSSKGNATPQDMMQSYARVNQGHYDLALTAGDLQIGFDRAVCRLRRPKAYAVSAHAAANDPPEPGRLEVKVNIDEGSAARESGDAVAVILDASGSMFKKLDGRFRYEIAREVLDTLVAEVLPDGIGFALRAFGNREPSQCRTDLEIELGPLDRTSARATINSIQPKPYAYTPIAESVANVPVDLADASGRKIVVLVTDGEESCDGDVEEQIKLLKAKGIDVQFNVIGFDIDADDKEHARDTFRHWASLGDGQYFDAQSAGDLAPSLTKATRPTEPFEVLNAAGDVVAAGVANEEPLPLPPGRYSVRFANGTIGQSPPVRVNSGVTTTFEASTPR